MIKLFRNKALKKFAERGDGSKLSVQNPARLRRILLALDAATAPDQMNIPGLRFHELKGEKNRYAVDASGNGGSHLVGPAKTQLTLTWRIITDEQEPAFERT